MEVLYSSISDASLQAASLSSPRDRSSSLCIINPFITSMFRSKVDKVFKSLSRKYRCSVRKSE